MSPEQLLGQLEGREGMVVADFEAGLGTLSRIKPGQLDVLLVVAEPTAKALEVAARAVAMIREGNVGRAVLVANRMGGERDRELVEAAFPGGGEMIVVPDDPAIGAADARGAAAFDFAPQAPAVRAVRALAEALTR